MQKNLGSSRCAQIPHNKKVNSFFNKTAPTSKKKNCESLEKRLEIQSPWKIVEKVYLYTVVKYGTVSHWFQRARFVARKGQVSPARVLVIVSV